MSFQATFSDPSGSSDIAGANLLVAASLSTQHVCWVRYVGSNQSLYLQNDAGSALLGPVQPGGSQTVSNSQCTLSGVGSSVTSGETLTLTMNLTFAPGYVGSKNLYMYTQTKENVSSGWGSYGTWIP